MRRAVLLLALALIGADLLLVVVSGGVSLLGPVETWGFAFRIAVLLALVYLHDRFRHDRARGAGFHGHVAVLLLLLPLLHYQGYRLRGDALWLYPYARSLVFDGDIDLGNEYRLQGVDHFRGSQPVSGTGLARSTFPIGAPLLWIPFVELGHAGVFLRNLHGEETAYDGYSGPYLHAVALGNLLIGWLGILVLDRSLRRWFSPSVAFLSAQGIALGSFLLWYLVYQPIYTHAATFLLVALLIEIWLRGGKDAEHFAAAGLVAGLTASVRWQNALFILLPAASLARQAPGTSGRDLLRRAGALGGGFLLGLSPQFAAWKILYDRFWIGVPQGTDFMHWSEPFLTETLFSSRHGLFSWSPILIAGALGLLAFARRRPAIGVPFLVLFGLQIYVNSAAADWWAGGSFGARRFDSALPILAFGLATALAGTLEAVRRRPAAVLAGALALVVAGNVLLGQQYRKGNLPTDDTLSWEAAAQGMMEDVFDLVGYPFSFPANWAFAWRYRRPMTQYDVLIGKYLFHLQNNLGGRIDLGTSDPPFIGNGWSSLGDWGERRREIRVAHAPEAGILVPLAGPETLRIFVQCAAPPGVEPRRVELRLNGAPLGVFLPGPEMKEHAFTADRRWWKRLNLLELAASGDGPFLAVDYVRFERL